MRRASFLTITVLVVVLGHVGCRSIGVGTPEEEERGPWWDVGRAEILVWQADDPSFEQDRALEGSGLVAHDGWLLAAAEKYAQLLRIDPSTLTVQTFAMDLPRYAEIEGITVDGGEVLLCDEANAAVWVTGLPGTNADAVLKMRRLEMVDMELSGGKLGVEGITVADDTTREIFLMLERSGTDGEGCRATIFKLNRQGDQ